MFGLHESTETLNAMKEGMSKSLETLSEIGDRIGADGGAVAGLSMRLCLLWTWWTRFAIARISSRAPVPIPRVT